MKTPHFSDIDIGETLGPLEMPEISRLTLALYLGASNDHNPIHIDPDAARRAGLDDVIAQGMLSMAYLGRLITAWAPQDNLRSLSCRFVDAMRLGERPVATGVIKEKFQENGQDIVRVSLLLKNEEGDQKVTGEALIELP